MPIHKNKYCQVLTLLEVKDNYGNIIHTKDKCLLYINDSKRKYNKHDRQRLSNLIISPSEIGIPQQVINNYYKYMNDALNNKYNFSNYVKNGLILYNEWLCSVAESMNKQKLINSLPSINDESEQTTLFDKSIILNI